MTNSPFPPTGTQTAAVAVTAGVRTSSPDLATSEVSAAVAAGRSASETAAGDAAGRVKVSLDALLAGLRELSSERLEERLQLVGCCESRLAAVRVETVRALTRRDGAALAADVMREGLKHSRSNAKREVKLAEQLAEVPGTSQALADGATTPQHARIIAEAAEQGPHR